MVVLACIKVTVTLVVLSWTDNRLIYCIFFVTRIDDFSDFLPFLFFGLPHKCLCDAFVSKHLKLTFAGTLNPSLFYNTKLHQVRQVRYLAFGLYFALFLVLRAIRSFVSSDEALSESSDVFVFSANNQVTKFIVRQTPDCARHLDCLFAKSCIPNLNTTVITCGDDFPRLKRVASEDKAFMAHVIHKMRTVKRPHFYNLVITDGCECVQLGYLRKAANDVLMSCKLFFLLSFVPNSDHFVLAACDCNSVLKCQN